LKVKNSKKSVVGLAGTIAAGFISVIALSTHLSAAAAPPVRQGTTVTYGVLAATTITNTGPTTISGTAGGDVGLSPGTSYTGRVSVTRSGVDHITDSAAAIAQADLVNAYNDLGVPTPTVLAAPDLAGQVLTPGTYSTASGTFANSGSLTLNGLGDPSAVFIFRAASTVITSNLSTMVLTNGAQACNVFWQVGSSATLGVSSTFIGHIYALTSITANTSATIFGQLLARNGAVTLNSNIIVNDACVTAGATATTAPGAVTAVPQPATTVAAPTVTVTAPTEALPVTGVNALLFVVVVLLVLGVAFGAVQVGRVGARKP
jgi:hypothetical protein